MKFRQLVRRKYLAEHVIGKAAQEVRSVVLTYRWPFLQAILKSSCREKATAADTREDKLTEF